MTRYLLATGLLLCAGCPRLPETVRVEGVQYAPISTANTIDITDVSARGTLQHSLRFAFLDARTVQVSGDMILQDTRQPAVTYPANRTSYAMPTRQSSYTVFELEMLQFPDAFAGPAITEGQSAEVVWSPPPSGDAEVRLEKRWEYKVKAITGDSVVVTSVWTLRVPDDEGFKKYVTSELGTKSGASRAEAQAKIDTIWAPFRTWYQYAVCEVTFDRSLPGPSGGSCEISDGRPGSALTARTITFTSKRGS